MNRTIKFRGKRSDNGQWIYGSYHRHQEVILCIASNKERDNNIKHLIIQDGMSDWNMSVPIHYSEVIPESIGEFTGLLDKNGKEIYEGDVISYKGDRFSWAKVNMLVEFSYGAFKCQGLSLNEFNAQSEVIGNIYENPELLK